MTEIPTDVFKEPFSEIAPGLWQGGYPLRSRDLREQGFDVIVLAAKELQPEDASEAKVMFPGVEVIAVKLDDAPITREIAQLAAEAAVLVARRVKSGKCVLVTCAQGKNRSGLVTALALVSLFGISGKEAVAAIKTARPIALTNGSFVNYLECLPAPERRVA